MSPRVRQSSSSGRISRQLGKPKDEFEGKLVDARQPLTHAVVPSVSIWNYCQIWNTVPCKLLYSKLSAMFEYLLKARWTTVSAPLIWYMSYNHVVGTISSCSILLHSCKSAWTTPLYFKLRAIPLWKARRCAELYTHDGRGRTSISNFVSCRECSCINWIKRFSQLIR